MASVWGVGEGRGGVGGEGGWRIVDGRDLGRFEQSMQRSNRKTIEGGV